MQGWHLWKQHSFVLMLPLRLPLCQPYLFRHLSRCMRTVSLAMKLAVAK